MRLFEVDAGSGREVLSVLKGLANTPGPDGQEATSVLPFKVIYKKRFKGCIDVILSTIKYTILCI